MGNGSRTMLKELSLEGCIWRCFHVVAFDLDLGIFGQIAALPEPGTHSLFSQEPERSNE